MSARFLRWSVAIVLFHVAVNVPHALAHVAEGAYLPPAANAFVVVVILIAPFVALGLLLAHRLKLGALLLFTSMLGALMFGIAFHYLLPGSDHVAHVPPGTWWLPFQLTSALLVVTEAAGAAIGGWMLYALSRLPATIGS